MDLPFAIGQVIAQKYRVDRVIGQGGMGVVVAGYYLELEQPVAIKFLLSEMGLQSEGAERFRREARAAAKIHSEHVARVFDIGLLDERVPYMVMELLHGDDLEQELERRGPLPTGEAVGYLLQAIDAVAEAHSVGIVHRDLKPTNLFLAQRADGSRIIKVLDFGISKSLGGRAREVALTRTAAFVGSPLYMSPEQMRSARDVDERTDVWALGAIAYIMLTGQLPHPGQSLPEVCVSVMSSSPRPLKDFLPDAPDELDAILMKCLAKDPANRFSSVAELAARLLPFAPEWYLVVERAARLLGGRHSLQSQYPRSHSSNPPPGSLPHAQRSSVPVMKDQPSPPSATEAPWSKTGREGRRSRRLPVIVVSVLGVVLALSIFALRSKSTPPRPAGSSASAVASAPSAGPATVSAEAPAPRHVETTTADAAPPASVAVAAPSASAAARPPVRAPASAGAENYTYFGGRR